MTQIGSCTHMIPPGDIENAILIYGEEQAGQRSLASVMLCRPCRTKYRKAYKVFSTWSEGEKWVYRGRKKVQR